MNSDKRWMPLVLPKSQTGGKDLVNSLIACGEMEWEGERKGGDQAHGLRRVAVLPEGPLRRVGAQGVQVQQQREAQH